MAEVIFTKSMDLALDKIKKRAEEFTSKSKIGSETFFKIKPTKRKEFTAKIVNMKLPMFYFSINRRLIGIFIKNSNGWIFDEEKKK